MTVELTEQQRQLLATESPARVIDPKTKAVYVLVPADVYDRVKALVEAEPFDPADMYGLLADLAPEDWEDASHYEKPQP
jgi:hypothetical protein